MESAEKEFHQCFEEKGGYFDIQLSEFSEELDDILNFSRDNIKSMMQYRPQLPRVNLNFIHNFELNACAKKFNGNYLIGINIGTWSILSQLFNRMLASPDVLIEFGDVNLENQDSKVASIDFMKGVYQNKLVKPNDPIRFELAQILTHFAIEFLAMHEYAHIVNGHIDYIDKTQGDGSFWEVNESGKKCKLDPLLSQTLEMDADCFGVVIGIQKIVQLCNPIFQNDSEFHQRFFPDLNTAFSLWNFAVYSMFRLFSDSNQNPEAIKYWCHPMSGMRQRFVFETADAYFKKLKLDSMFDNLYGLCLEITVQVEKAYEAITTEGYNAKAFRLSFENKECNEHGFTLIENWNNVRPELEKYATGVLAPLNASTRVK